MRTDAMPASTPGLRQKTSVKRPPAVAVRSGPGAGTGAAAKRARLAMLMQDIRSGVSQLADNAEVLRRRFQ